MFPHQNMRKYTWTSPDRKTHNQIVHILIERRWHSSVGDVQSFREADCDTDHCVHHKRFKKAVWRVERRLSVESLAQPLSRPVTALINHRQ